MLGDLNINSETANATVPFVDEFEKALSVLSIDGTSKVRDLCPGTEATFPIEKPQEKLDHFLHLHGSAAMIE